MTGDVEPTGIDLTTEAEIFTSVAERVEVFVQFLWE